MGANTRDAPALSGLILARRQLRGANDLLVKASPNAAAPVVFGDLYFGPNNYTLTALGGSYTVTGQSASFILSNRRLTASGGAYAIAGQSAILLKSKRIVSTGGAYSIAGQAATLLKSKRIVATGGAYSMTGAASTYTPPATAVTPTQRGGGGRKVYEKPEKRTRADDFADELRAPYKAPVFISSAPVSSAPTVLPVDPAVVSLIAKALQSVQAAPVRFPVPVPASPSSQVSTSDDEIPDEVYLLALL